MHDKLHGFLLIGGIILLNVENNYRILFNKQALKYLVLQRIIAHKKF